jgi:ribosomal protein L11
VLGQFGVNIQEFCTQFNNRTSHIIEGTFLPTAIIISSSTRTFTFEIQKPNLFRLFLLILNKEQGFGIPSRKKGRIHIKTLLKAVYCISLWINNNSPNINLKHWCKQFLGSVKSWGYVRHPKYKLKVNYKK